MSICTATVEASTFTLSGVVSVSGSTSLTLTGASHVELAVLSLAASTVSVSDAASVLVFKGAGPGVRAAVIGPGSVMQGGGRLEVHSGFVDIRSAAIRVPATLSESAAVGSARLALAPTARTSARAYFRPTSVLGLPKRAASGATRRPQGTAATPERAIVRPTRLWRGQPTALRANVRATTALSTLNPWQSVCSSQLSNLTVATGAGLLVDAACSSGTATWDVAGTSAVYNVSATTGSVTVHSGGYLIFANATVDAGALSVEGDLNVIGYIEVRLCVREREGGTRAGQAFA